tara:strand:+ start:138 stop:263 length:126 start_codon:yes stop_codon:yes gene_type:complete
MGRASKISMSPRSQEMQKRQRRDNGNFNFMIYSKANENYYA